MDRLDAMRAFVRVVDTRGFTRAAEALNLNTGTVSRMVQILGGPESRGTDQGGYASNLCARVGHTCITVAAGCVPGAGYRTGNIGRAVQSRPRGDGLHGADWAHPRVSRRGKRGWAIVSCTVCCTVLPETKGNAAHRGRTGRSPCSCTQSW